MSRGFVRVPGSAGLLFAPCCREGRTCVGASALDEKVAAVCRFYTLFVIHSFIIALQLNFEVYLTGF